MLYYLQQMFWLEDQILMMFLWLFNLIHLKILVSLFIDQVEQQDKEEMEKQFYYLNNMKEDSYNFQVDQILK